MIPSPCLQKCKLANPVIGENFCTSCKRTAEEISGWRDYPDTQRQAVLTDLPNR